MTQKMFLPQKSNKHVKLLERLMKMKIVKMQIINVSNKTTSIPDPIRIRNKRILQTTLHS